MADGMVATTAPSIGLGDAMIMARQGAYCDNGYNGMWNNPFMYLIWLAMFNNGFGGFGNGNANNMVTASAAADIKNAVYASNDQQTLMQMIRQLGNGLADVGYAAKDNAQQTQAVVNNGFNTVNSNMAAVGNELGNKVAAGFNQLGVGLVENRFAEQQGVAALQASIAAVNNNIEHLKFDNAQNTDKITTALHNEGEHTRALIQTNVVQDLRDRLVAANQELQSAKFAISQGEQNQYLINALKNTGCGCNM